LGNTETPGALADYFVAAHPQFTLYRRGGARAPVSPTWRTEEIEQSPQRTQRGAGQHRPLRLATSVPRGPAAERGALPVLAVDLLAEVPWGVVVVDRRYDVQSINRAARHLLGIYRDAVGE